jgi:hypothetical protein
MEGYVECNGHEKRTRQHAQQQGQRVRLLPALHATAQRVSVIN